MPEVGAAALPVLVGLILLFGYVKGVPVFDTFLSGAKEGLRTSLKLLPTLVGLLVAVSMVRASGMLELLCVPLAPVAESLGVSPELLPLALLRPISGSGALAVAGDLLTTHGPDSYVGRVAAVMLGSTETTFYTIAVYFGAAGISKSRHTVPAALTADLTGFIAAAFTVRLFFG